MNKIVSVELLNKILNYLGTKPFIEVSQLIGEIVQLKDADVPRTK